MRVALVHDFLVQYGGAEKVLEALHEMYPDAPVYTSAYDRSAMPAAYAGWDIRTSFLQRLPAKRKLHRLVLPLYPLAFESFDLSEYDLVVSSSSSFAKGVITQPNTLHVCYTHAPMRYAWTTRSYLANERGGRRFGSLLAPTIHYLRLWDQVAASRVDSYVANSSAVARRIAKYYRREARVVAPPVDTSRYVPLSDRDDYYLAVSRFVPYKRIDLAVEALARLDRPLKVVGTGRQAAALKARAGGRTEFLGWVSDSELPALMARARAFLMPGEEDFGIAPVEANASGTPVIAYAAGGALDSQVDGVTGVLFPDQSVDGLCAAVQRFEGLQLDPSRIRANAARFDVGAFKAGIAAAVEDGLARLAAR